MNQVKVGAIISYMQMVLNAVITLLYTPLMISLLGNSEYGLYNTVASVISIIALLDFGFSSAYVKFFSRYKAQEDRGAIQKLNGMFLIMFISIAVIAALCGMFLTVNLEYVFSYGLTNTEYKIAKRLLPLLTFNLAITLTANAFTCIITAQERFVFFKLLGIMKTVISPLATIPVLVVGYGSIGMVLVTVSLSILCDIIYVLYVLVILKERFVFGGFDWLAFKEVFVYTLPIAAHLLVDQINWNVDKVLLGRIRGTADVAIYSVGFSLYTYYRVVGAPAVNVFVPRVHQIVAQNSENKQRLTEKLTELFVQIGRIQYCFLALVATGFIFWGKDFIALWVGVEYTDAYYVALLLMIPGSIDIIQNIGIEIQRAQNLHAFRAKIYVFMAVINVGISILLCPKYGAAGCAAGTALSLILVQGVVINVYYYKKCNINIIAFWTKILYMSKGIVPAGVCGIIFCYIKPSLSLFEFILVIAAYTGIYCVSMLQWGMSRVEREKMLFSIKAYFTT